MVALIPPLADTVIRFVVFHVAVSVSTARMRLQAMNVLTQSLGHARNRIGKATGTATITTIMQDVTGTAVIVAEETRLIATNAIVWIVQQRALGLVPSQHGVETVSAMTTTTTAAVIGMMVIAVALETITSIAPPVPAWTRVTSVQLTFVAT